MKERLVRGTNLVGVVRLLRAHRRTHQLPEFGPWEQDLMRKRVSPTTWYSLQVFESLLQIVHRYVFDGSEAAAQNMGRASARALINEQPERVFLPGKPLESLHNMGSRWRELFNFGEITVTELPADEANPERKGARIHLAGFPDMSACVGHNIMGWSLEVVESAGGKAPSVRLEERPWMHNNVLTYVLDWT
ncbi:MAG: hypothetical protein QM778_36760 [Myxococcales bacterium]